MINPYVFYVLGEGFLDGWLVWRVWKSGKYVFFEQRSERDDVVPILKRFALEVSMLPVIRDAGEILVQNGRDVTETYVVRLRLKYGDHLTAGKYLKVLSSLIETVKDTAIAFASAIREARGIRRKLPLVVGVKGEEEGGGSGDQA